MLEMSRAILAYLWFAFAQVAGVLLVAGSISYGVLHMFANDGPVIEVVEGPSNISTSVPYGGILTYRISTRRTASCPGTVIVSFSYQGGGPPVTVLLSRPIMSTEIKQTDNATVYFQLPESVYPGRWLFRSLVDSTCPTRSQQDVTAQFPFEVTRHVD